MSTKSLIATYQRTANKVILHLSANQSVTVRFYDGETLTGAINRGMKSINRTDVAVNCEHVSGNDYNVMYHPKPSKSLTLQDIDNPEYTASEFMTISDDIAISRFLIDLDARCLRVTDANNNTSIIDIDCLSSGVWRLICFDMHPYWFGFLAGLKPTDSVVFSIENCGSYERLEAGINGTRMVIIDTRRIN